MYISKNEYLNLPHFKNYKEAIAHFKKRSGEQFIVTYSREVFESHKIYYCYLLFKKGDAQLVQIHEDGLVKVEL